MNVIELRDHSLVLIKTKKNKHFIDVHESKTIDFDDGYKNTFANQAIANELTQEIKQFFSYDHDCLLCLSISNVIYRDVLTPKTNEKYLKALVKHELINALNLSSDYLIDYAYVGEIVSDNVKQNKLLVCAIQTNNLTEILQFFTLCGLTIKKIDVINNALINYVRQTKLLNSSENTIIVDISSKQIRQFLFENGQFSYHRITRVNLNNASVLSNYSTVLDAIEKMIQFSIAQGRIKQVDTLLFIGFPFTNTYIESFEHDLNLKIKRIDLSNSIHFKQSEDVQLIYALSLLYKPEKKNIDLMILFKSLNKKSSLIEIINPMFVPIIAVMTYIIMTTLIILVIKTSNTNKSINEINAYLAQDDVMFKMYAITEATGRTHKMNEILVEIENIQVVLDSVPRLNQAIIRELYTLKPDNISVQSISYANNSLEIVIETPVSSSIFQYVLILKEAAYFKDIQYNTYLKNETSGNFESTLTVILKELE